MEAGAKRTVSHFQLTHQIIKAALAVHSELGPGLLESTYEACLAYELRKAGLEVKAQVALPVVYQTAKMDLGYRIDLLVEDEIIVEIKSIEKVAPVHKAQLLSYLRLSKKRVGLLINFNVTHLKDGIHRVVNGPNLKIPSPYPET